MLTDESRQSFVTQFNELVASSTNILLMSHMSPDDDSVSSMLTTLAYIKEIAPEKPISLSYSGMPNLRWSYFENFNQITFIDENSFSFSDYDLFIGVDACQFGRFVKNSSLLENFTGKVVFIDHHKANPDKNSLSIVLADYSSCAELIYTLFYETRSFASVRTPETIMLGILGDTGSFKFVKPEQSGVFRVAERLVREGKFDIQELLSKYSAYPESILIVIQELVRNISFLSVKGWPRLMVATLPRAYVEQHKLDDVTISSAAGIFVGQYGTSITECTWSLVLSARGDGSVSVSMRSRPGSVNVRLVAEGMGLGGGHDRASGMKFSGEQIDPAECLKKILDWMEAHSPTLA